MRQLVRRVGRVGSGVDAASGDDAEEEDRVPDVVERMDADAFAWLKAEGLEARGELADGSAGGARGDVVLGLEGIDVDLVVSVICVPLWR